MKPVRFHRLAREELEKAVEYYERHRSGLGLDLQTEVEAAVRRIAQNPLTGALYKKTRCRHCLVRRFPYVVFYREFGDTVWIVAVAHGKRRPDYWSRRRPQWDLTPFRPLREHGREHAMTVSPEVEELVRRVIRVGDYPSEDAVLLAALHALGERRQAEERRSQGTLHRVSPLGLRLREMRSQYVAGGGELLTIEQFDRAVAQRRGERNPGE
jgi:toxin ParE1/3/4